MKKILLSIIYFLACILTTQAQTLYGLTFHGGNDGGGAIFKFNTATNNLIVSKSFESVAANPVSTNFIQASDGKLYGMTSHGGSNGSGVIFSFDPSSSHITTLKDFNIANGADPSGTLLQANDGKLYGMTPKGGRNNYGVIFSFDPSSSAYVKLWDFDLDNGVNPEGGLIQSSDGKLYGMTPAGGSAANGTIFSFDISSSTYTKLVDFDNIHGGNPVGSLILAGDGKLYGMTRVGGNRNVGTIFSFEPSAGSVTTVKHFEDTTTNGFLPAGSLVQASDGKLYGVTYSGGTGNAGVIFSFDLLSSTYTKQKDFGNGDGIHPNGSLVQANDGKLYGMTPYGGSSNGGTIFSFDPSSSTFTKVKDFNLPDGFQPNGSLIQANDGELYGMTNLGGNNDAGVIFSFDSPAATYTKRKDLGDNQTVRHPRGSLLQSTDGNLWAMARDGGSAGYGGIFSFDPVSSVFGSVDFISGGSPGGSLIQATNGQLYGMAVGGARLTFGFIFSFSPASGYSVLKNFGDLDAGDFDGAYPLGSLVQASDGKLYGMTYGGGPTGYGVIFSLDPVSSIFTKLVDFNNTNGANPYGNLMQASDGKLYGMTVQGGSSNAGVIFSFDPSSSTFTKLKDFNSSDGIWPYGSLMQASNGKLYGMTVQGGNSNYGVIFSFDPSSSAYTKLKDFDSTMGAHPFGSLMQASNGKLYGMTYDGGSSDLGVIFSLDPSSATYTKLIDFNAYNGANPSLNAALIEVPECITNATYFKDADNDGYGSPKDSIKACTQPDGYVVDSTDCDDGNPDIHPGATEVCNGIDDNCDGQVDEGLVFTTYYPDADGDGYGTGAGQSFCNNPGAGYATKGGDCDDANPAIHPGAVEICNNAIDDNCNGQVDEDCNGTPTITINDVSVIESQGVAVLTVSLSHTTTKPVWLLYFTKDGTATGWGWHKDYEAKLGLLVIRPGSLTATISIKIIKDDIAEPTEYFDVILLASLNAIITDRSGRVFISDEMLITNSKTEFKKGMEATLANSLEIKVMPNPTVTHFNLTVKSNYKTDKINMKVMDVLGKLIETRSGLSPGQTLRIGGNYRPGTYFIQAIQGKQRRTMTVIKLSE